MSVAVVARAIAQVLGLVGVGVVLRATKLLRREHAAVLNRVIVYVALPALILRSVYSAPLSWEIARIAGIAWLTSLVALAVAWGMSRLLRLPPRTAGAFILVAAIGNTGYLGYPLVKLLLGEAALPRAIFYDVFGTVGVLFTVGVAIAAATGEHDEGRVSPVRELLTFPAMIALLLALAARAVPVPEGVKAPVGEWLVVVANMTVPMIMISLGLSLTVEGFRGRPLALAALSAIKLLAVPAIALGVALALGERESLRLVVLQASMPTMMLSLVVGQRFGLDEEFIASAILVTTVACALTIPAVQLLLR